MNEINQSPILSKCIFLNNNNQFFHFIISSNLIFDNCIFNNTFNEDNYGGAIQLNSRFKSKKLEFIKCNFSDIKSTSINGGAISYLSGNQCPIINFRSCHFTNLSSKNGGAIYISSTSQSSLLLDNQDINILIEKSTFTNCQSEELGGAIYADLNTKMLIESSTFNEAKCGSGNDSNGIAIYVDLKGLLTLKNIAIEIAKLQGKTAIYATKGNEDGLLEIEGGCFISTSNRDSNDDSPTFIFFDAFGDIQFSDYSCFNKGKDESIKIVDKNAFLEDGMFNCNRCTVGILPSRTPCPTRSFSHSPSKPPTPTRSDKYSQVQTPTRSVSGQTPTSHPVTQPGTQVHSGIFTNSGSSAFIPDGPADAVSRKAKLSIGAIAGIVVGILIVLILLILLIILLLRRKRSNDGQTGTEQISEEVDNDAISQFTSIEPGNLDYENPLYNYTHDNDAHFDNMNLNSDADPFMRDFEENI